MKSQASPSIYIGTASEASGAPIPRLRQKSGPLLPKAEPLLYTRENGSKKPLSFLGFLVVHEKGGPCKALESLVGLAWIKASWDGDAAMVQKNYPKAVKDASFAMSLGYKPEDGEAKFWECAFSCASAAHGKRLGSLESEKGRLLPYLIFDACKGIAGVEMFFDKNSDGAVRTENFMLRAGDPKPVEMLDGEKRGAASTCDVGMLVSLAYSNEADRKYLAKSYDEAARLYTDAIGNYPFLEQYENLGNAYYYLKRFETAMEIYRIAIELKKPNENYYHNLALCQFELAKRKPEKRQELLLGAVANLECALDLAENPRAKSDSLRMIAEVRLMNGEMHKAFNACDEALRLDPSNDKAAKLHERIVSKLL